MSAHLDKIAENIIKASAGKGAPTFPADYLELGLLTTRMKGDFPRAWSEFLHSFYAARRQSQLDQPAPDNIPKVWRVILAGAAEYLAVTNHLKVPGWVYRPEFYLPRLTTVAIFQWDAVRELTTRQDLAEFQPEIQATPIPLLKRNVVFDKRNLITL
jgi:hypothetical protein